MNTILVRHKWEPYVWLLPSLLLMTIFVVFPIAIVFRLSFIISPRSGQNIALSLSNYVKRHILQRFLFDLL